MPEHTVAVPGGDLAVLRWPIGSIPVLAAHGISGNALIWGTVAQRIAGVDLIAPDLRGRGRSRSVAGPYGLARHADDLVLVLDDAGVTEPVVLVGHSMGAFVAGLAAVRHPDRFARLVLVDGGLAFTVPAGVDLLTALSAMIGPALGKLEMGFESVGAYLDFWRAHPSFADWSPDIEAFCERDLAGTPPHLRSACVAEALRTDGVQILGDQDAHAAIHRLPVPATLLWAERGMFDEPTGLYDNAKLTAAALPDTVDVRFVPGVNHYSIALGETGADAVAAAIDEAIAQS